MITETDQPKLFETPPEGVARRRDPATSKAAARDVRAGTLMDRVLSELRQSPAGLTTDEIARSTGISIVSVSPRMAQLVKRNLIKSTNTTRKTASGHEAIVWKAI
jgi:predicted transcriptional regulator